jgi:hypothetical protein
MFLLSLRKGLASSRRSLHPPDRISNSSKNVKFFMTFVRVILDFLDPHSDDELETEI